MTLTRRLLGSWLTLALIFMVPSPSFAFWHGIVVVSNSNAQINLGSNEIVPSNFVNILKSCPTTPALADINKLDANGYLTTAPSTNLGFGCSGGTAGFYANVKYRIKWPATRTFSLTVDCSGGWTLISGSATTTGCTGSTGTVTSVSGQPGEVETTLTVDSWFFPTSGTYAAGSGEIAIFRSTDEALYNAGQYWTAEFVNEIKAARPGICRFMGMVNRGSSNWNGEANWNYRPTVQNFSWASLLYPPGILSGSANIAINGTDTYTASSAPDTPGTITANEMFMGILQNANTSTTPTLNIGGRGAKTIVSWTGGTINAGALTTNTLYSFFYDSVLNAYVANISGGGAFNGGGIVAMIPIEAQIQLSNLVGCDLWTNIPAWADDNYVTNEAQIVASNLNSGLNFYPEFSNEVWNGAWPQSTWSATRAVAMGLAGFNEYYGIRVKQIAADAASVWSGGLTSSTLRPVMAYQAATDTTVWTHRFEGAELCPVASGGSCSGNSVYNTFTGSASWNAFPNRPIDAAKVVANAPYSDGENMCNGPDFGCTLGATQAPFWQAMITAWEAGSTASAETMIDNDLRNGQNGVQTVTASGTTFTTPSAHGFVANSTNVMFSSSGGTAYSGVTVNALYRVTSVPTSTTFTVEAYVGGQATIPNINAGTAGTGTTSVGISSQKSMMNLTSTWYAFLEANAARYNGGAGGSRPAGMGNLIGRAYEGSLELTGLTSAQCTAMSIVASNCVNSSAAAVLDWRNSALAYQSQLDYMNEFRGTYAGAPNFGLFQYSVSPSQLILNGGSVWAFVPGYTPSLAPYETYYGFGAFNFLLKRDLDPLSNDNDPMWLEKAA